MSSSLLSQSLAPSAAASRSRARPSQIVARSEAEAERRNSRHRCPGRCSGRSRCSRRRRRIAAICEPSSRFSDTTASVGSRRDLGQRCRPRRPAQRRPGAGREASRWRRAASAPRSRGRTPCSGSAESRCGADVQGTCRAPERTTASRRLGSASTRTSCPRSTSALGDAEDRRRVAAAVPEREEDPAHRRSPARAARPAPVTVSLIARLGIVTAQLLLPPQDLPRQHVRGGDRASPSAARARRPHPAAATRAKTRSTQARWTARP